MKVNTKRVYESAEESDGYRVLVDRLWPRGIKKQDLQIDEWCKDIAPSKELREWFHKDLSRFNEFAAKYEDELRKANAADMLAERAKSGVVTLLYAAKDKKHNHAQVLKSYLERHPH